MIKTTLQLPSKTKNINFKYLKDYKSAKKDKVNKEN